jgi:transposase
MDTYIQPGDGTAGGPAKSTLKRQHRTVAVKRRIVEETLVEGASVARIARSHGVNANQVFYWRTLYRKGRLGTSLLPVTVQPQKSRSLNLSLPEPPSVRSASSCPGTIHIDLRHAQVRIEGNADPAVLRVLLECLQR